MNSFHRGTGSALENWTELHWLEASAGQTRSDLVSGQDPSEFWIGEAKEMEGRDGGGGGRWFALTDKWPSGTICWADY